MTPDLHATAAAVVQAPSWRWMPGMIDTDGRRVLRVAADGLPSEWVGVWATSSVLHRCDSAEDRRAIWAEGERLLPDLSDPATLGCLLVLVREAWGDPTAACSGGHLSLEWRCNLIQSADGFRYLRGFDGATEPTALVAALLAAGSR